MIGRIRVGSDRRTVEHSNNGIWRKTPDDLLMALLGKVSEKQLRAVVGEVREPRMVIFQQVKGLLEHVGDPDRIASLRGEVLLRGEGWLRIGLGPAPALGRCLLSRPVEQVRVITPVVPHWPSTRRREYADGIADLARAFTLRVDFEKVRTAVREDVQHITRLNPQADFQAFRLTMDNAHNSLQVVVNRDPWVTLRRLGLD